MSELNPYAPPQADVEGASKKSKKVKKSKRATGEIAEAIERLNEHLGNPANVERDRKEAGGKMRTATIGFAVVSGLISAGLITMAVSMGSKEVMLAVGLVSAMFIGLSIVLVVVDLQLTPRHVPSPPKDTLKHFFKAIALGRLGYAWAALCPTARHTIVEPPELGDVPVGGGSFELRRTRDLKEYLNTFARPGTGQMRTMQIKRLDLLTEDGDVAIVEVEAVFQAWPQWAQIVSVVGFILIRLLGIILFVVLYLSLRKTRTVLFRKTLIRGSNNVWYVYSADLLERAVRDS